MGLLWAIAAALLASAAAAVGAGLILALGARAERAAVWLLAFAAGTLLGSAALGLLPEALERAPADRTLALFLAGVVAFFAFERLLRARAPHAHRAGESHRPEVEPATAAMILWGDGLHNLVDGFVLGVAVRVGPEVALPAAFAVFAHEVPQEVGDFAVLLGAGMRRGRAFLLNGLSALATVPGAIAGWGWSGASSDLTSWLLPLAAGGFVYIALAGLVPALQRRSGPVAGAVHVVLLVAGIAAVSWLGGHAHG
jgi:zinc and cadmium transporter